MVDKQLAAIVVAGDCRERAQRVLDSLSAQTIADAMELVVVDLATRDLPRLVTPPGIPTTYVCHRNQSWARARAEGVFLSNAPIVAFIEDHCVAAPGWGEALVRAYTGPWASVGYVFTCPKPESYLARAALIAENGMWLHPMESSPAQLLSCGNVSYRRELLLAFGAELELLLTPDFNAHERLKQQGEKLYVESGAIVSHESFEQLSGRFAASFVFCRMLAANRARTQLWGVLRRSIYAMGTLVFGPMIALGRLATSLTHRPSLWRSYLISLPVIIVKSLGSALGESVGYLVGSGESQRDFDKWELHLERTKQ